MNIHITPNDYKEVTECREGAVQGICDAFLCDCIYNVFHPDKGNNTGGRNKTNFVRISNGKAYGFSGNVNSYDELMKIRKCEVELAIKLLLQSGYHLYRYYQYGNWVAYRISKSPRENDKQEVTRILPTDWSSYFE